MSHLWPTTSEAASLRFLVPMGDLRTRVLLAGALFTLGLLAWCLVPVAGVLGLGLVLLGHVPLWVRQQTNAPGGATPKHEDVWAPVEDEWLARVADHEARGERWDATPWDVSNGRGCLVLLGVLLAIAAVSVAAGWMLGGDALLRLLAAAPVLFVPLWINGMRTTWNPSELRKKGDALAVARSVVDETGRGDFEPVPMLALREGPRGRYPVDARLMLRPAREDGSGFLGVQVQVAMNNVQGTDYPYLYAVVLGKGEFRLPPAPRGGRARESGVDLVFEPGADQGVRFLVVRQHADRKGGWHTEPDQIRGIVGVALDRGRQAWRENGGEVKA